jgi:hypothetical protein
MSRLVASALLVIGAMLVPIAHGYGLEDVVVEPAEYRLITYGRRMEPPLGCEPEGGKRSFSECLEHPSDCVSRDCSYYTQIVTDLFQPAPGHRFGHNNAVEASLKFASASDADDYNLHIVSAAICFRGEGVGDNGCFTAGLNRGEGVVAYKHSPPDSENVGYSPLYNAFKRASVELNFDWTHIASAADDAMQAPSEEHMLQQFQIDKLKSFAPGQPFVHHHYPRRDNGEEVFVPSGVVRPDAPRSVFAWLDTISVVSEMPPLLVSVAWAVEGSQKSGTEVSKDVYPPIKIGITTFESAGPVTLKVEKDLGQCTEQLKYLTQDADRSHIHATCCWKSDPGSLDNGLRFIPSGVGSVGGVCAFETGTEISDGPSPEPDRHTPVILVLVSIMFAALVAASGVYIGVRACNGGDSISGLSEESSGVEIGNKSSGKKKRKKGDTERDEFTRSRMCNQLSHPLFFAR